MDTPSGPEAREDCNNNPNTYVDLLPETHDKVNKSPIPFQITQSQKRRRKFIPLKYHSKIFKKSKKKTDKNRNEQSTFKEEDFHRQEPRHAIDDNRVSTSSSSYASCRPYRTNVSCHTYVDIEECNRDMEIERCNSISTVATLPIDLPMPRRNEQKDIVDNSEKRQLQKTCIQEESPMDMTPRIHYEMKVPDKSKGMKKYMVLFCIVLVSIVVSTVLAGYFGTKDVVGDIPTIVQAKVEAMPGWGNLETLLNQTEIETLILNQGFTNLTKKQQTLSKRFENLTSQIESDFSHFKNETQANIESIPKRFMNETDFLAWKEEVKKDFYTTVHLLVCVNDCTGHVDGHYQSCNTCYGYVSCVDKHLTERPCANGHPGKPLVWDDVNKTCEEHFRTCHPLHTFDSKSRQLNTFD